jgi:CubicO group peptidase (beta-lactamase class C family)
MVSNSSGLVGLVDNPLYGPYLCQYLQAGTLTDCGKAIYTADDSADRVPPDTEFHYGGGQWQLAGAIAEFVSGKPWADLVRETYVQPCNTTLGYANQYQQAFASGGDGGSVGAALSYPSFFSGDPNNLAPTQNPSIEGGAYGTAEDYGKILLMHLRGGRCDDTRVLSEDAVARMQIDRILSYGGTTSLAGMSAGDFAGYGLGWWVDRVNAGIFADPGAYGAMPWLDLPRHYAAIIMLEADTGLGTQLYSVVKPLADAAFDAAK